MNKKTLMRDFINRVSEGKLMTQFIINIFGYENLHDYNYLFRMIDTDSEVIIDIYDNISDNRFNRYIFSFASHEYDVKVLQEGNVFVNYISVLQVVALDNNLLKLSYLFKIEVDDMLDFARTFLDDVFLEVLIDILKKPI